MAAKDIGIDDNQIGTSSAVKICISGNGVDRQAVVVTAAMDFVTSNSAINAGKVIASA